MAMSLHHRASLETSYNPDYGQLASCSLILPWEPNVPYLTPGAHRLPAEGKVAISRCPNTAGQEGLLMTRQVH